jgi:hypothetical protein
MDHQALLKALRDDLAATRRSHDLITAQIAAEEAAYWSKGVPPWIDRGKEAAIKTAAESLLCRAIKTAAESLLCRNEQTMKAWFDSVD